MKKLHFIIVVLLFIRTPVVLGLDIKGEKEVPVTVTVLSDYRLHRSEEHTSELQSPS